LHDLVFTIDLLYFFFVATTDSLIFDPLFKEEACVVPWKWGKSPYVVACRSIVSPTPCNVAFLDLIFSPSHLQQRFSTSPAQT
jgi:hypothetical protein